VTLERPADSPDRAAAHRALLSDLADLGGAGLAVTVFGVRGDDGVPSGPGQVRLGAHRAGPLPLGGLDDFDILLSVDPQAPRPWVAVSAGRLDAEIAHLRACVDRHPVAAAAAAQTLRMTLALSFEQALVVESLGYSMLLASSEFKAWRAASPARVRPDDGKPRVRVAQEGGDLHIRLARPSARNAFDARMRDELAGALEFAGLHPDQPPVILSAEGPAFSAGGDLDEFGRADDAGHAHLIRTARSPIRLLHAIAERVTARVHGACIGAGIEVPAAAARVTARPGAVFRLPEVAMGLIPGAGGTASIPRRIGRHRACYMAVSGTEIDLETALAWGLADAIEADA
jgi:enoyl-CoA hydratase/carnithine racemase